ncbi:hypothetical protein [Gottfriedia acidiceleris]|uniref:hypothetical protein n=1 Tax=Gottfriedia acidiceleris TaxID=371036 RepID=UPI000B42E496|nr:hypothetical protein [Gottfriedia acidiceleris]
MSFIKKIKFNKASITFKKLEMKFQNGTSRDFDLVSWMLIIDHLMNGAETQEQQRTVDNAVNVYKNYLHKHFPTHSFLNENNGLEDIKGPKSL